MLSVNIYRGFMNAYRDQTEDMNTGGSDCNVYDKPHSRGLRQLSIQEQKNASKIPNSGDCGWIFFSLKFIAFISAFSALCWSFHRNRRHCFQSIFSAWTCVRTRKPHWSVELRLHWVLVFSTLALSHISCAYVDMNFTLVLVWKLHVADFTSVKKYSVLNEYGI